MSRPSIPAAFSRSKAPESPSELAFSAAAAVSAWVITPNDSIAMSGAISTLPSPVTAMVAGTVSAAAGRARTMAVARAGNMRMRTSFGICSLSCL